MHRLSFIITILGLFSLISLILFLPAKPINYPSQLTSLPDNTKVQIHGKVIEEGPYGSSLLLKLNNNIFLICSCPLNINYKGKNVSALGYKDSFSRKNNIQVLKIKIEK